MTDEQIAAIEARASVEVYRDAPNWAQGDVLALVQEVRRLRTALAHYADGNKWKRRRGLGPTVDQDNQTWYVGGLHAEQHGYDIARAALGQEGGT